jgi:hypothetical protein
MTAASHRLCIATLLLAATAQSPAEPLRVLPANPRYFTSGDGKAVLLAGSHTWSNFHNLGPEAGEAALDYDAYLDFLKSRNHNFFRLWACALPHGTETRCAPFPWQRTGPGRATDGGPRFDLHKFDQAYFDLLRSRVAGAQQRGIYVAVMLFDGFGVELLRRPTDGYPLDQGNNINGISAPGTTSQELSRPEVTAIQDAYVGQVIDTVNDLDNVLYEIANEAGGYSTRWQYHMIELVRQIESRKPKQHPVGMTWQYKGGSEEALTDSPADWISPGERLPQASGAKVIINDTDHSFYYTYMLDAGPEGQREWAWKNFTRGNNLAFMDPYLWIMPGRNAPNGRTLDPYWNEIRNALTDVRRYSTKVDLAGMTPHAELLADGGFCLANPGREYLVFAPGSVQGSSTPARAFARVTSAFFGRSFALQAASGTYSYEWFNPSTHRVAATGSVTLADGGHSFTAPFHGAAVLWLRKASP